MGPIHHARRSRGGGRSYRQVDPLRCTRCQDCLGSCPEDALRAAPGGGVTIDPARCTSCGKCVPYCRAGAILRAYRR